MQIQRQRKLNTCLDGNCPDGIESLKRVGLTPKEKRTIFFALKDKIFQLKMRRIAVPVTDIL